MARQNRAVAATEIEKRKKATDNDNTVSREALVETSDELIIGLVGHAGAGCTKYATSIDALFESKGYDIKLIKMSDCISDLSPSLDLPAKGTSTKLGRSNFERAEILQDAGDQCREKHGRYCLASRAIQKIRSWRKSTVGTNKNVYIIDSIKHADEVSLFRDVYGSSFRLMAIHSTPERRFSRLFGPKEGNAKFAGVEREKVQRFVDRDEKDGRSAAGQQVQDVFFLADYFLDGSSKDPIPLAENEDLIRFCDLILGAGFHRPTVEESMMYAAFAAARQSSCLSRQVGATLMSPNGNLIATGSNDVPKFKGGTYLEDSRPDNRCASWISKPDGKIEFVGCHNSRHKNAMRLELQTEVGNFVSDKIFHRSSEEADPFNKKLAEIVDEFVEKDLPNFIYKKLNSLIEYSRSIHAEMDALFTAMREGKSAVGSTLFCTTFPCHNCARHLVTAGVERVFFIEPYVKSLALELHEDAITTSKAEKTQSHMEVLPYIGIGPRMFDDHFNKRSELKNASGEFVEPNGTKPLEGIRLKALNSIEENAAQLISYDE